CMSSAEGRGTMSPGRQAGRGLGPLLAAGLVALGPGLVAVGTAHAAGVTYYVATSGTDSTCRAGQASSTPLRTIGFALGCAATDTQNGISTASSPDTIQVAAGTYSENLP